MLTEKIKNLITDLNNVTPENIGVGYGHKIQNGEDTRENSIIFLYHKKNHYQN